MLTLKKGVKSRLANQSFRDLFDDVEAKNSQTDEGAFDLRLNRHSPAPCAVADDKHFSFIAKERSRTPAARALSARNSMLGEALAKGWEPGKIAHEMVNPAGVYAPAQATPNLVLQTPQDGFIGDIVAPPIPTPAGLSTGLYYEWTPGTTHRLYDNRIVKGEEPKSIEMTARQFSYTCAPYALANRLYETDIANSAQPLRMREQAALALDNAMRLSREARVLNVAFSPLVPGAAAAGAWSAAGGGLIVDEILAGLLSIFRLTQNVATDIFIPYDVGILMPRNAQWTAVFQFSTIGQVGPLLGVAMALANFGLNVHFSKVCVLTTHQGTASDPLLFANIIGNQVLITKTDPQPTERSRTFMFAPSRVRDEVRSGQWDREVKTRSFYWQQYEETCELLVDASSGYRITGV